MKEVPEIERLKAFVDYMLTASWNGLDVDGAAIQEVAEVLELIKPVKVTEYCGEHCNCKGYELDFPFICYRKTYD